MPTINGLRVDLYKLFSLVQSMGGWRSVSARDRWSEIYAQINIDDEHTLGMDYALKRIYVDYLAKYEQFVVNGDDVDADTDVVGTTPQYSSRRSTRMGASSSMNVGSTFSLAGVALHNNCPVRRRVRRLPMEMRRSYRLAPTLAEMRADPSYVHADNVRYENLYKSLLSGLPNEVDFALNTLTLLSHPGPKQIDLTKARRLVAAMCAHAGAFR